MSTFPLYFFTSSYTYFDICDAAAYSGNGTVVVDSATSLSSAVTSNYTTKSAEVRFMGGQITLGSYNLTLPANTVADPYASIFVYSGTGQIFFLAPTTIYANWWGAPALITTPVSSFTYTSATGVVQLTFAGNQPGYSVGDIAIVQGATGPNSNYVNTFGVVTAIGTSTVSYTIQIGLSLTPAGTLTAARTNSTMETATYNAFQNAELAVNGLYGSIVSYAPGYYVLDVSQTVMFQTSHHIAEPGSVRIDFDPSTVPGSAYPNQAIFFGGNPTSRTPNGQRNTSFAGAVNVNTPRAAHNCNFVGAMAPLTVSNGLKWIGIDIVHNPSSWPLPFLGANKFCSGIVMGACFNVLVKDSWFVGMANDGLSLASSSGTVENCHFWFNGFYGGAADGDSTRNGMTFSGWWDLLEPELTTEYIRIVNCTAYCNADTGIAPGGCSNDTLVSGCSTQGNGNISYEFILFEGEDIKQWGQSLTVRQYDMMYVPVTTAGQPALLGGLVFQCSNSGGGTTSTTGTGPTGTVGQTGILDGSVTWICVGYMRANGRIPATYSIVNCVDDGAIPAFLDVPYLGKTAAMPNINGNGVNTEIHVVFNAGNEKHVSMKNVLARNFGYTAATSPICFVPSNDGGTVDFDGVEYDNCYVANGAGLIVMRLASQAYWGLPQGTAQQGANGQARVRLRNIKFRNPTYQTSSSTYFGGHISIYGNLTSYDIENVDADNSASDFIILIEHSYTAASTLEQGRIAGIRSNGCGRSAIYLSWTSGGSVLNGIDFEDNHCWGCAQNYSPASPTTGGFIDINGSATYVPMVLRFTGNRVSYGGAAYFVLQANNISPGSVQVKAHNNNFMEQSNGYGWTLRGSLSNDPLTGGATIFAQVDADNNGLPGERKTRAFSVPTTGTFDRGDQIWLRNPSATGSIGYFCTTAGTFSGQMTNCSVTISAGNYAGTFANTGSGTVLPPLPGEYVTFGSGPTGIYRVLYAYFNPGSTTQGVIAFVTAVNNSTSGAVALVYSNASIPVVLTGLTIP